MDWKCIISQARARSGLTQPQLAQLLGCSQAHISDLVRGRQREPRYSLGLRLLELANSNATPHHPAPGASDIEPAAAGQGACRG